MKSTRRCPSEPESSIPRSPSLRIPSTPRSLFSSRSGRSSPLNVLAPLPPPSPQSRPLLRSIFTQGIGRDSHPSPQPLTSSHPLISPRLEPPLDPLDTLSSSWGFTTTREHFPSGLPVDSDGMTYSSTSPWHVPGDRVELGQTAYHSHPPFLSPIIWAGRSPEPQTNINGGTFIGGNVTQTQQEGEQGELSFNASNRSIGIIELDLKAYTSCILLQRMTLFMTLRRDFHDRSAIPKPGRKCSVLSKIGLADLGHNIRYSARTLPQRDHRGYTYSSSSS
jgi:hypothetical protein